mmetsp:Transcript_4904/g.8527  ORF Transcript_4904/g.8527 Transcript_4904/m.8527 type:complete len:251 (-) Transcript_4904:1028-1780(-)
MPLTITRPLLHLTSLLLTNQVHTRDQPPLHLHTVITQAPMRINTLSHRSTLGQLPLDPSTQAKPHQHPNTHSPHPHPRPHSMEDTSSSMEPLPSSMGVMAPLSPRRQTMGRRPHSMVDSMARSPRLPTPMDPTHLSNSSSTRHKRLAGVSCHKHLPNHTTTSRPSGAEVGIEHCLSDKESALLHYLVSQAGWTSFEVQVMWLVAALPSVLVRPSGGEGWRMLLWLAEVPKSADQVRDSTCAPIRYVEDQS